MHLRLVPQRMFSFEPDFGVLISEAALSTLREDAPTANTPKGLEDLRYVFSDMETNAESAIDTNGGLSWFVPLMELAGQAPDGTSPLANHLYARTKIAEAFAQWQATRFPERQGLKLLLEDCTGREGIEGVGQPGVSLSIIR